MSDGEAPSQQRMHLHSSFAIDTSETESSQLDERSKEMFFFEIDTDQEDERHFCRNTRSLIMSRTDSDEDSIKFPRVLVEENRWFSQMRTQRYPTKADRMPFSVAFSGGGIRAAAFQAGVLWRLASMDRLQDVEYLAAVSGGAYIASAFASQCVAAEPPRKGCVRQWYLDVVAKTLSRMQDNSGDFVRDCVRAPGWLGNGAGRLPRFFDTPILLLSVGFTLMVNPIMFFTAFVVPFTISIQLYFSPGMRAGFCVEVEDFMKVYQKFSPLDALLYPIFTYTCGATCVVYLITKLCPCFKLIDDENGTRPRSPVSYLVAHATNALLKRATAFVVLLIVFVALVPALELWVYSSTQDRLDYCEEFIRYAREERRAHEDVPHCFDDWSGIAWYEDDMFIHLMDKMRNSTLEERPHASAELDFDIRFKINFLAGCARMTVFLMGGLICSICVMPFVGARAFMNALMFAGPFMLLMMVTAFVQYGIYSAMTKNTNGFVKYSPTLMSNIVSTSFTVVLCLIPFYEEVRGALHTYYKRSLQKNFFFDGKDPWMDEVARCPYLPFLILTVTSSDYQPPGKKRIISELSISSLHTGSEETDYVRTPVHRSLAKSTALSGAGCLDAISLSMTDAWSMRFWLEVLNLSWGDYILFERRRAPIMARLGRWAGPNWESTAVRFFARLPVASVWLTSYFLFKFAFFRMVGRHCQTARLLFGCGIGVAFTLLSLSFFSFFHIFDLLSLSAVTRQFLQSVQYFFVGRRPPRMLYVTDGGVRDCTAIVQLMRRQRKRILLILAAADPNDDLGVLKAAMSVAEEEQIASFYDRNDPRRSIQTALDAFKHDKAMPYLHLGICYNSKTGENVHGHLIVVKNRLPPSCVGQPVQPPLTEEEITSEGFPEASADFNPEDWHGLSTDGLGPFGCCDCCHTSGCNCGPKFPHGTFTGYLYLSPQWFNSLARLGFSISEEAIQEISKPESLSMPWEQDIDLKTL